MNIVVLFPFSRVVVLNINPSEREEERHAGNYLGELLPSAPLSSSLLPGYLTYSIMVGTPTQSGLVRPPRGDGTPTQQRWCTNAAGLVHPRSH